MQKTKLILAIALLAVASAPASIDIDGQAFAETTVYSHDYTLCNSRNIVTMTTAIQEVDWITGAKIAATSLPLALSELPAIAPGMVVLSHTIYQGGDATIETFAYRYESSGYTFCGLRWITTVSDPALTIEESATVCGVPNPSATPTATSNPTSTPEATLTPWPTITPVPRPTRTPRPLPTRTPPPITPTPTPTATRTPRHTPTPTPTCPTWPVCPTATPTPTPTPTCPRWPCPTPTSTP